MPEKKYNPIAPERQRSMYVSGMGGKKPIVPTDVHTLEQRAKQAMSKEAYAYIAGGAGKELSMRSNREGFDRWKILPRMLKDVGQRDTSIELFGKTQASPLLTAPIGVLSMAHKQADLAVAKTTASLDIPMIFSNQASYCMEDCAKEMGDSTRWFQLYWSKSNDLVKSLVQRAERAGCSAIAVTLDTTMLGWRNRDLDLGYLPFLRGLGIAQYTSDPVFNELLESGKEYDQALKPPVGLSLISNVLQLMRNYPGSFFSNISSGKPLKAVRQFINIYSRPTLTWEDISFLRECSDLPILLKGILHPEDAHRAVQEGINGIIVSNHGGRQVDGSVSSIEMLPEIAKIVNGAIPVLIDSGIRTGADVFKALALGANAVCVGRPYCYGLAIAGAEGVKAVLENIWAEFELTMGLAGCSSIGEIGLENLRVNND